MSSDEMRDILTPQQIQSLKFQELRLKKKKLEIMEGLPHLYGRKFYSWARLFFESTHRQAYLVSGNQLSKSSTAIRKIIHWATAPKLWSQIWPSHPTPRQFWYFYPMLDTVQSEFENKWIPEWLPRNEFKNHPQYGWTFEKGARGYIDYLQFNTGVRVYFKTYTQDIKNLQSSTVHYINADEEMPSEFYDELIFRLSGVDGILNMVFTATLGQPFWQQVLEGDKFPEALKIQVSIDDCEYYEDGTKSPWTPERIKQRRAACRTRAEELKRCDGKFVPDSGRMFSCFNPSENLVKPFPIHTDWPIYAAVDVGSGGTAHPAGIVFIAVNPDYTAGYVFRAWRGDNVDTSSSDILDKFRALRGSLRLTNQAYDFQSRDFGIVSARNGESFVKAQKGRSLGEDIVNTLFRNNMLFLFDDDPEIGKLVSELSLLQVTSIKRFASDDLCDALRYCVLLIPWDFTRIGDQKKEKTIDHRAKTPQELELAERRGRLQGGKKDESNWEKELESEFDFWNDEYGS
jgi:phage terminase large subunit-like protein